MQVSYSVAFGGIVASMVLFEEQTVTVAWRYNALITLNVIEPCVMRHK